MQTVIETQTYLKAAASSGMTDADRDDVVTFISKNPEAGDAIEGSGGCRKVRIAGHGKGKSGGFRLITFFSGSTIPVFLLTVYSKGKLGNLSKAQIQTLKNLTKQLIETFKAKNISQAKETSHGYQKNRSKKENPRKK